MGKRDPRVDTYIAKSPEFARPILEHLRRVVHQAVPGIEETMKWSAPHFDYKGVFAGMAAFKRHVNFILWKASLVIGPEGNHTGSPLRNLTRVSDLPPDKTLIGWLKKAAALNDEGVKNPTRGQAKKPVAVPSELKKALAKNKKAAAAFAAFPPSHKREYAEWVGDAKGAETRERRVATAIEWIAEGKSRNWKYERR